MSSNAAKDLPAKSFNWIAVDFPFAPRSWPFFYGWVMVGGSILAMMASIPGQTSGVGVFQKPLSVAWGLSTFQIAVAYMIGTLVNGFVVPFSGSMVDRIGVRRMIVFASVGLGIVLLISSNLDRLVQSLVAPGGDGSAAALSLPLSMTAVSAIFFGVRFFGQGCLAITSRVLIGKWFNHRRGLATAIAAPFMSVAFTGAPILLNALMQNHGWRGALIWLAVAVGIAVAGIGWIYFRDNPEECGLHMDGVPPEKASKKFKLDPALETKREFTRVEAMRTFGFWPICLAIGGHAFINTGLAFHLIDLGAEMGLAQAAAVQVLLPMTIFSVVTVFVAGWAADRYRLKYLLTFYAVLQLVGTYGMTCYGDWPGRIMLTIGLGAAGGFFQTMGNVAWPRYYGRRHLGAINGVAFAVMVFSSAMGPAAFGWSVERFGSFRPIIFAYLALPVAVFITSFFADNPQEKIEPEVANNE